MCECPIGLVECKYPKSCFKFCNSCIKRQMQDELDYIISEAEIKAYNQALEDLFNKTLDVISNDYSHPYLGDAIYGLVNDAMVDAIKQLKK